MSDKGSKIGSGFGIGLKTVYSTGYYRYMRFKQYINLISGNQIIKEKLIIIKFFDLHGAKLTKEAFGVSRSTVHSWKKKYKTSKFNPKSLLPKSRRPKNTRKSNLDPLILDFIKQLRLNTYKLGKSKIKVLLDQFCFDNNIQTISESLIGKIIKKYKLTFPPNKIYHNPNSNVGRHKRKKKNRISSRFKPNYPGEMVQIDSITVFKDGIARYLITGVDLYSRFAFSFTYKSLSSKMALDFMKKFQNVAPFKISNIKTDNGHEFLGHFEEYLKNQSITQFFSYPRTPKSNAFVERFNRSIQEEFVKPNIDSILEVENFNSNLMQYLIFFNSVRPHRSLENLTPMGYLIFKGILSNMCVTHTKSRLDSK